MDILIFAIIVLIVCALVVYMVDMVPVQAPFNMFIKVLIILVAIILICNRAGLI